MASLQHAGHLSAARSGEPAYLTFTVKGIDALVVLARIGPVRCSGYRGHLDGNAIAVLVAAGVEPEATASYLERLDGFDIAWLAEVGVWPVQAAAFPHRRGIAGCTERGDRCQATLTSYH